ncbi:FkbM family methyltransferase [Roseicitreum antarcticum]|uniref:FkbM family methyltransferase n=1 Tax=Roseicitreum antarcticum TaxID=564137 RepID=UPI0015A16B1C|nr:FkbM family methyltransferase [Roseicitreum antarcticum]
MPAFTLNDITLEIPAECLGKNVTAALQKGTFEHGEARALSSQLLPGDRLLELGSGTGYLACLAARIIGGKAITGVEAFPRMAEVARANLARNKVAGAQILWGAAVPDTYAGAKVSFSARQEFWGSSIVGNWADAAPETQEVPALKIGPLLDGSRATVLSCDIEGGELALFDQPLPDRLRMVIMEIHPRIYGNAGTKRIFDALSRNGLTYYPYGSQGPVVVFQRV